MSDYVDVIINRKSEALDRLFTYSVPPHLRSELEHGMLIAVPFHGQKLEGVAVRLHDEEPEGFEALDILDILHERPLFSDELLRLSAWMSDYYLCSRAAALQAMLPAGMSLSGRAPRIYLRDHYRLTESWQSVRPSPKRQSLIDLLHEAGEMSGEELAAAGFGRDFLSACVKAGLLNREQRRVDETGNLLPPAPASLSPEQEQVLSAIREEQAAANRPFLLHGVTGSGKTEVYLQLIREQAAQGKQSIVLVPEIALSVQMVDMLLARLELPVAVLHSGLKGSERRHIWQEIAENRYPVVVGARSAVFAPTPSLGLIIIDEAHETSYKQDNNPRFHAVTVAEKRCEFTGASLVLGSATPGVEQSAAAVNKRYAYGTLRNRYFAAPLPEVEVVDLREELRQGNSSIFSRPLQQAIRETLEAKDQAVLFLNRRGYYQHYSCRDCGVSITCPHCAVAMSYHEEGRNGRLKCHYCGRSIAPPALCPTCGSRHIRKFGVGTQRVAMELEKMFPDARVLRLDSDVTEERGRHEQVYRQMREGEADILVGTQMVAKGLDFPHLTLAAVVAADTLLNLPDWRAGERTYQLITQLAGRAGRRDKQGRALIQTYTPEAPPIRCAAAGDYRAFYLWEMENRRLHGYPPYTHLIRVLLSSQNRLACAEMSRAFAHYLRQTLPEGAEICGPADAPLARIKDRWRRQLIVKWPVVEEAAGGVDRARSLLLSREKAPRDLLVAIDVDPFGMM
ncbi:MAG: primosomal protein N' [Firmicutes bacterium]|nr:primosomal protein N' [Bacillota bacterium]